jgi:hypothetical protein
MRHLKSEIKRVALEYVFPGAPAGKRGLAAQGLKDFFNHSSRGNTFLFLEC